MGEHRAHGERKYYLANLLREADLRRLAATIKARWVCEQAHRRMQEGWRATPANGLDHFEGRSWTGLHRHALMTMLAYAFLQHQRPRSAERGKGVPGRRPVAPQDRARPLGVPGRGSRASRRGGPRRPAPRRRAAASSLEVAPLRKPVRGREPTCTARPWVTARGGPEA